MLQGGAAEEEAATQDEVEPTRADLSVSIQGCRTALEHKIETLSIEVNLLRADLHKVSDKVTTAEGNIVELQVETVTLKKQMAQLTTSARELERRAEYGEGCS
ncbi:hypothetical protein NDU88_000233 [Pleurodeles waltl]|uniref:Uncharacterized protein n=1 Tax=Pleurodeles waltl TaxID=8319 RepID=A0AAV7N7G5_PLEWA|nr:hypothetical protein NDU88_000233 [Pleurodeles waltl]